MDLWNLRGDFESDPDIILIQSSDCWLLIKDAGMKTYHYGLLCELNRTWGILGSLPALFVIHIEHESMFTVTGWFLVLLIAIVSGLLNYFLYPFIATDDIGMVLTSFGIKTKVRWETLKIISKPLNTERIAILGASAPLTRKIFF